MLRLFCFLGRRLAVGMCLIPGWVFCQSPPPQADGIKTSKEYTVQELIQDIFVKGGCKNITNIRGIGNPEGIGFFENGESILGLKKGIIISTGHIGNAEGPNSKTDRSGDFSDGNGDVDLSRLSTGRVFDAVGIEFDFVPLDSMVTFRYVFASEEYCEYVGSKFNDVFGFFISGPGIQGSFSRSGANVALLPGSGDYVSINSINHLQNQEFYVPNELEEDTRTCSKPFTASPLRSKIEFDGFTKVLTATLKLIPCQSYHLRLVVGDVNDNLYDSAVFLEAESFNIGGEVTVQAEATVNPTYVLEGCPSGHFLFQRVNVEDLSRPVEVRFKINPTGTAIEGVDYDSLPRSVIIPAGALSVRLPVSGINDLTRELPETIILELDYPCDCVTGDATMSLIDPPDMRVELSDEWLCPGDTIRIQPVVIGGSSPFVFTWNTGATDSILQVSPKADTLYRIRVVDACGQLVEREAQVRLLTPAQAEISGYQDLCPGNEGAVSIRFTGLPPWQLTYTIDGREEENLGNIRSNPFSLPVTKPGVYELMEFRDQRCAGETSGSALVEITDISIEAKAHPVSCNGLSDGRVDVVVSGGDLPYTYLWDQDLGERKNLQNVPAGNYTLLVTDSKGCRDTAQITVTSPATIRPVVFDCLDLGTDSIAFEASGGTPPYQFSVDGTRFADQSLFSSLQEGRLYNLVIRDARGCRLEQEFIMPANTRRYVELTPEVTVILGQKYLFDPQFLIPPSLVRSVQWSPSTDLSCTRCLQPFLLPKENRTYTLQVTDRFGCTSESTIIVNVNRQPSVFIPTAFSPNNDGHNDIFTIFADPDQVHRIRFFQVFNRWGNLLHEVRDASPNDPQYGWDGRFGGQWQLPGIYIYSAEIELVDGNILMKKGDVMLMR